MAMKELIKLTTQAASRVTSAIVSALSAVENTGLQLNSVCEALQATAKGAPLADETRDAIVNGVARAKGWKGATAKTKRSEVGAILRAYATLPDAVKSYQNSNGHCDFTAALGMARYINKGATPDQAARKVKARGKAPSVSPEGRTAGALKSWYKVATAKKRAAILQAADLLNLKLGVKVEK